MYKNLISVGGFTLLSRGTGFLREIATAALLGTSAISDAYFVAVKLPNHFRAIFGEGAFNYAYVPCYTRVLHQEGKEQARLFASQIAAILLTTQIILLALAWAFMPYLVDLLAPGFRADPQKFDLTVNLTNITFPYLLLITLVTLQGGTLNAHGRFIAAAFAPVLMNLAVIAFLAAAYLFPNAGVAAAWGVLVSGFLQLGLTSYDAYRAGILEVFTKPRLSENIKYFFRTLGPAMIGSAGLQVSIFADTIIGSLLPTGGFSSIYYAERIYQLPLGVIGIAAGTVLLPEMSRYLALGDRAKAFHAQNRTLAISLVLGTPFFIAFIMLPDVIMHGVFQRGAFTAIAASQSAHVLMAYGFGLIPIVLLPSVIASFRAQADTKTPMLISLIAVALNVSLKILLFSPLGAVGLATATAAGAWTNLGLLIVVALRRDCIRPDQHLAKTAACASIAAFALALTALFATTPILGLTLHLRHFGYETGLILICGLGASIYAVILIFSLRAYGIELHLPHRKNSKGTLQSAELK